MNKVDSVKLTILTCYVLNFKMNSKQKLLFRLN